MSTTNSDRVDVLDRGFVELLDVMGDDFEPARAARISYGNHERDRTEAQDARLMAYLSENRHTTPFEMVELKWRMKLPIFVARQFVRHRTANINEFSMRYADPSRLSDGDRVDFYVPDHWRRADEKNKQGSVESPFLPGADVTYMQAMIQAVQAYHQLQELGVANEMARMVLPVSVYTEWVWKNDLHNTLHFLRLRADGHAQWEAQEYARAMLALLRRRLPKLMAVVWPEEAPRKEAAGA